MSQLSRDRTLRKSRIEIKRANHQFSRTDFEFENDSKLVITEGVINDLNDGAMVMVSPIQSRRLRFCGGGNQLPPLPRRMRFGGKCSQGRMPGVAENAHGLRLAAGRDVSADRGTHAANHLAHPGSGRPGAVDGGDGRARGGGNGFPFGNFVDGLFPGHLWS